MNSKNIDVKGNLDARATRDHTQVSVFQNCIRESKVHWKIRNSSVQQSMFLAMRSWRETGRKRGKMWNLVLTLRCQSGGSGQGLET